MCACGPDSVGKDGVVSSAANWSRERYDYQSLQGHATHELGALVSRHDRYDGAQAHQTATSEEKTCPTRYRGRWKTAQMCRGVVERGTAFHVRQRQYGTLLLRLVPW